MVFGLFKRTPPETQLLIRALEDLRIGYDKSDMWDGIVIDAAVKGIAETVKTDHDFAKATIGGGGWTALAAGSMLVSEWAHAAIMTGETHIYRGVMNDHGKALLKLYKFMVAQLLHAGKLTEAEAVEQVAELLDEIKKIG
ncbi:hypothetical protein [Allorhizobium undicola]|uniref:hypothetical protein n=1 Tax=Allorhizobium undicola TaxID=78527 RepID=UPI00048365A0|nr:hypothetical protein [Allorhizobium undicola]